MFRILFTILLIFALSYVALWLGVIIYFIV